MFILSIILSGLQGLVSCEIIEYLDVTRVYPHYYCLNITLSVLSQNVTLKSTPAYL